MKEDRKQLKSLDQDTQQMLDVALERVIEGTDLRIRAVTGYKRKLYKSILKSLEYADSIVEQIPHAIDLTPKHFVSDPYIRALFPTLDGLKRIFKQSSELHDYFTEPEHINASESCALLCMHKEEQTIHGMELKGEQVHRDVRQTRVLFSDHRVYSPAESETNARRELKCCIFEGLVNNALAKLSELRTRRHQLEVEQHRLNARLRQKRRGKSPDDDMQEIANASVRLRSQQMELEKVEEALDKIGYLSPELCLELVNDILSEPDQFVRFKRISVNLDRDGIKRPGDQASTSIHRLNFSEVNIQGQPSRVVTLANFNRQELEESGANSLPSFL
ncbi:MAG: hypothetical protein QNJ78_14015 [Gammaproteobacteria bacterium]|nr:hypothetical protein [Gammaproteobacteria bacterium]